MQAAPVTVPSGAIPCMYNTQSDQGMFAPASNQTMASNSASSQCFQVGPNCMFAGTSGSVGISTSQGCTQASSQGVTPGQFPCIPASSQPPSQVPGQGLGGFSNNPAVNQVGPASGMFPNNPAMAVASSQVPNTFSPVEGQNMYRYSQATIQPMGVTNSDRSSSLAGMFDTTLTTGSMGFTFDSSTNKQVGFISEVKVNWTLLEGTIDLNFAMVTGLFWLSLVIHPFEPFKIHRMQTFKCFHRM